MKKLAWLIIALFPVSLLAQGNNFIIDGKLGNFNYPAMVYLTYSSGKNNVTDSSTLKDGVFKITGAVTNPVQGFMVIYHLGKNSKTMNSDVLSIWLETGHMQINSIDSLRKATITGSGLNDDQEALHKAFIPFEKKMKDFYLKNGYLSFDKHETADYIAGYNKEVDKLNVEKKSVQLHFMQSHPNSLVSLMILNYGYGSPKGGTMPDLTVVTPLFNSFSTAVKNSPVGLAYQAKINSWKQVGVGSLAPDFTQFDPEGKNIKLYDYKGKYILVDFWASWCHPCRGENPNLVKMYNLYKDKNFTILSVSIDQLKADWLRAVKEDKLPWMQVSDLKRQNDAYIKYGVLSIPDNFFIDPDGKIIAKSLHGEDLNKKLKEVLDK